MNELLQKHGCANVFSVPEGLKELMTDITREVLRQQPPKIFDFVANYLSVLLITREHGILAVRILDDLCDCRPSVSEHLLQIGMEESQAKSLAQVIKEEIEEFEPSEGKEKLKESLIMKKILTRAVLDEDTSAKVCQIARNAYRDFWYRKKLMEQNLKVQPNEPWEIAAEHTLALYKKTKPSFSELTRATQKIQAAYRGYHVRKNLLRHLKPEPKKTGPKVELLGPPIDVAASREIDLGPIIDIKVHEDDVVEMFDKHTGKKLGLKYDPMRTITHIEDEEHFLKEQTGATGSRPNKTQIQVADLVSTKSLVAADVTPKPSRVDTAHVESMQRRHLSIVPEPSHIHDAGPPPTQISDMETRKNHLLSQMSESTRQSRVSSYIPSGTTASIQKISFVEMPTEIITDAADLEECVLKDVQQEQAVAPIETAAIEIPIEELPSVEAPLEADMAQEIPEDMLDDRTDGDGESAPTASVPSSTPDTAEATDVEDADILDTTGEEAN
ncbi:uncharacterized protein ACR2FA_005483 [Aphomia sociella]